MGRWDVWVKGENAGNILWVIGTTAAWQACKMIIAREKCRLLHRPAVYQMYDENS